MSIVDINNFRVFWALVRRDIVMIKKRWHDIIINGAIRLIIHVLLYGSLFPIMGMDTALIAPLYLGAQTLEIFFLGVGFGQRNVFDIRYNRFIDYRLTLPLSKRWLFASYIAYFSLEALIITAPLMTIGIILLGKKFVFVQPNWIATLTIYVMTLGLYGLLFLGFSLYYQFEWYRKNLWVRRVNVLFVFSPLFFVWQKVHAFSPLYSYIMLLSPLTYPTEGIRAAMIGGPGYIPASICIPITACFIALAILFVTKGVYKRLDPV